MGNRIKQVLTILIFAYVLASAATLNESIYRNISALNHSDRFQTVKIYHEIKNLYIKSIINDNKKAQIASIKGLIECSKILKLKYRHYEVELSMLLKSDKPQNRYKKKKSPKSNNRLIIRSLSKYNNKIILTFNKPVQKKDIYFFELNNRKKYRDVFDVKAILVFKAKRLSLQNIKSIRISQFNKKTVRIVLQDSNPINSTLSIEKDKMIIKVDRKNKIKYIVNYTNRYFSSAIVHKKIIVIDPGHGGKDTGAIGYKKLREKNAVLKIALKLGQYLREDGYKVFFTRSRDVFIPLRTRTHFANIKKANLFISIHANAAPKKSQYLTAKGVETYFLSPARSNRAKRVSAQENRAVMSNMDYYSKQVFLNFLNREKIILSNKLAIDVQRGILENVRKRYNIIDGGVRKAPFWVLVGAQMPAILIETGYITNPTEARRLFNPYYESLLAKGIANGVVSYFEKNR